MKLRELWGIPIPGTEKSCWLKDSKSCWLKDTTSCNK